MGLFLFTIGAVFGFVFILNNIIRTVRREHSIMRIELVWVFFTVLLPVVGLLYDNLNRPRFDALEWSILLLVIPLTIIGAGLTLVESLRPKGLRGSRGILSMGMGALLISAAFSYNVLVLFVENATAPVRLPTPVNAINPGADPCVNLLGLVTDELFDSLQDVGGLSDVELAAAIETSDGSQSLAQIITDNGGDIITYRAQLDIILENAIRQAILDECIPALAGNFVITQLDNLTPVIFDTSLNDLLTGNFQLPGVLGSVAPDFDVPDVNEADLQRTRVALAQAIPTLAAGTEPPTITPTPTPTQTPTPTITRTPRPTASATATRQRYLSPTPTLTPTLPNPCIAVANFNVNMRTFPDLEESEVVATVPFETVFSVFGPDREPNAADTANEDIWWFGNYEGDAGWISGAFISLTNPCFSLPVRDPGRP
jgi:hypothetical protein